jgi:polysaccharide deacetylase family protein (PEP-CTERM system associated)
VAPLRTASVLNAMTIDVEDYFHVSAFEGVIDRSQWDRFESRVCANTERLLEMFDAAGIRSTFFVLGWVAERFPQLVRRLANGGHEIASHGYAHRLIYNQTPDAFREDVRRAKGILESIAGAAVHGYRAPSYSITTRSLWAIDVLIEEGYTYDSSIFPIRHDRYGIPDSPRHPYWLERASGKILEAPATTTTFGPLNVPVAGGGYFRLFPYRLTRWGLARVNRLEQRPAVFYLHPWEIDPAQPRLRASMLSGFRHYNNLDKTETRLRRLLQDFRFGTMRQVLDDLSSSHQVPRLSVAFSFNG